MEGKAQETGEQSHVFSDPLLYPVLIIKSRPCSRHFSAVTEQILFSLSGVDFILDWLSGLNRVSTHWGWYK